MCKAGPSKINKHGGFNKEKAWKGNTRGAGRPLSYPTLVDKELLSWILIVNDVHLPVSALTLQKNVKSLILSHNSSIEPSEGWISHFKEIHDSSICKRTSLCQRLSS